MRFSLLSLVKPLALLGDALVMANVRFAVAGRKAPEATRNLNAESSFEAKIVAKPRQNTKPARHGLSSLNAACQVHPSTLAFQQGMTCRSVVSETDPSTWGGGSHQVDQPGAVLFEGVRGSGLA